MPRAKKKFSRKLVDLVLEPHAGVADCCNPRPYKDLFVESGRGAVISVSLNDGELYPMFDPFIVAEADIAKEAHTPNFHPDEKLGIVHDPHGIGLFVADPELLIMPGPHA